ncbi:hypothetical protein Aph01nite_47900 [Acrocarpospora phusangensis]|uniref:Carrier domain-containing protein n=1 Tax=Acrocarpospora phusangensis TaxID=1070424 RepID=A0A919USI7_9ACTN|nr:non-ribosomal peptide synthetase [Acrocarpospora phusangensis]GIH26480.1 hypothetical protein Aph01nite_47900 [Acrocarpospora phusangensis]
MNPDTNPDTNPETGARTLTGLFAATVARHGSRPAVRDARRALTYARLDALSSDLAGRLAAAGVRPGDHVALLLDRGAPTFVALLGVLKAGAAYVAVESRYPRARKEMMLRNSGARLALVEPGGPDATAGGLAAFPLDLDELRDDAPAAAPAAPGPGDAACVLFTSGSTGTPKAAVLEHRNLVFFAANPSLPRLTPEDRVGHVSSVSFDAFHYETWCAFAAGAEVVTLGTMPELIGGDVQRELRRTRVTAMLVPSMALNHIVREDRNAFAGLRVLCTGGDVIFPATCRDLLAGDFAGDLYNLYGPTEATTACAAHHVTHVPADAVSVPIGRPLAGAEILLLDEDLAEVPAGRPGQIYIGGPGLARGYQGGPELSARRFVTVGGRRFYASGDLARRDGSGLLDFHGRADNQVKIRGYRVEPEEVERVLARHPEVRDAVVIATGGGQDRRLAAFVEPHRQLPPRNLREYAAGELPEFMVPASFIQLDRIPVNDHGKRDLGRLAELLDDQTRREDAWVSPRDEVERYLAGLWEELLSVERIGAADDFFARGGNSLLAFRMQQRIKRELEVPLGARDVLTHSELNRLADLIRTRGGVVHA